MTHATPRSNVNALPPGGPRTVAGKARSSQNSLRHGLTAKQTVIPGEDQAEFDQLHDDLVTDRKPVGELEFQLVGEISACMWRLARARRHEAKLLELSPDLYGAGASKLELVMRYVTSIERQLQRTIVRLDRLQKDRRALDTEQPDEVRAAPAALKVMAAGCSAVFSKPADEFVSQTTRSVQQDARSVADADRAVRFAS